MYVNKCIKCGREFETKNPKRVICPDCLYPDKSMMVSASTSNTEDIEPKQQSSYSTGGRDDTPRYYSAGGNDEQQGYNRTQRPYNNRYNNNRQQGYNRNDNRQGGYNNNRYNNNRQQGGYNNNYGGRQQGYNRNDNRQGGYNNRFNNNRRPNNFNKGPKRPQGRKAPKQLLVSKEQLEQIELLYKQMLPLPNPDCHEVIAEKIGVEPRKVFFGINLIRQKMMLPKLPFPKRKLAISPDQLFAIKNLYEPLLPLPPIGCHKIIAAQLKMDEWRVHVGIGLVRSQMGLGRWNEDRPDLPEEFKKAKLEAEKAEKAEAKTKKAKKKKSDEPSEETSEE